MDAGELLGSFGALVDLLSGDRPKDAARVRRIRRKLDRALEELGVPGGPAPGGIDEVESGIDRLLGALGIEWDPAEELPRASVEALRRGDEITAIYHYRKATGASLKEAMGLMKSIDPAALEAGAPTAELTPGEGPMALPPGAED